MSDSPNVTQRSILRKTTACVPVKATSSRKSISNKKVDDNKPKNTIQSMFAKQLEKSRIENSQTINGTIEQITSLDLNDPESPPQKPTDSTVKIENDEKLVTSTQQTGDITLVTGTLHKRLTRRNSMTIPTPTKIAPNKPTVTVPTPSSTKKRRCTMFTPSFKGYIDEEQDSSIDGNTTAKPDKSVLNADKTVNKTIAMDVCSTSKCENVSGSGLTKSNSKMRQLLNDALSKTPRNGLVNKLMPPNTKSARRTTFTAQAMDETKVQNGIITPVSLIKRRMTINPNAITSSSSKLANPPELNESNSCDAILTPTNKILGKMNQI